MRTATYHIRWLFTKIFPRLTINFLLGKRLWWLYITMCVCVHLIEIVVAAAAAVEYWWQLVKNKAIYLVLLLFSCYMDHTDIYYGSSDIFLFTTWCLLLCTNSNRFLCLFYCQTAIERVFAVAVINITFTRLLLPTRWFVNVQ